MKDFRHWDRIRHGRSAVDYLVETSENAVLQEQKLKIPEDPLEEKYFWTSGVKKEEDILI